MQRIATMTFLSGWIGFLGVSALLRMAAILAIAGAAGAAFGPFAGDVDALAGAIRTGGNAAVVAAMAEALGALVAAGLLVISGWLFRGSAPGDRMVGDRLALGTFAVIGAIYGLGQLFSTPVFPDTITPAGFFLVLGGSMLALVLDRLVEIAEPDDDEPQFRAAVALIGRRMAQDAHTLRRDPEKPGR